MPAADRRNLLVCLVLFVVAVVLVDPRAPMPFNDDFSYAFTAKRLAETGKLAYNGWSGVTIVPQVYWGAWAIRLFHFSFTLLRLTTLPAAGGSIVLTYLIARRARLSPAFALLATLGLGLSPMFLPLSVSFMSDVPGLFFELLSLYLLIGAAQSQRSAPFFAYLLAGAAIAALGDFERQIVGIIPLAVLPYLAITRRARAQQEVACGLLWFFSLGVLLTAVHWFNGRPYALPQPPLLTLLSNLLDHPGRWWKAAVALWLTSIMLSLPAGLAYALQRTTELVDHAIQRLPALILAGAIVAAVVISVPRFLIEPWLADVLSAHGLLGSLELSGARPVSQPQVVRQIIAALSIAVSFLILVDFIQELGKIGRKFPRLISPPDDKAVARGCVFLAALGYFAAALLPAGSGPIFDRYALPLVPLLSVLLLGKVAVPDKKLVKPALIVGGAVVSIFALYGVAATEDFFALARASHRAVRLLEERGFGDNEISTSLENDLWEQLRYGGYINHVLLRNPPYDPTRTATFALHRITQVAFGPVTDSHKPVIGQVEFRSWLPPFHRTLIMYGPPRR